MKYDFREGQIVAHRDRNGKRRLMRVVRLTPTQVVLGGEQRYRRKDGQLIGGGVYYFSSIWVPTAEEADEIRDEAQGRTCRQRIDGFTKWKSLSLNQLQRIVAILDELEGA